MALAVLVSFLIACRFCQPAYIRWLADDTILARGTMTESWDG